MSRQDRLAQAKRSKDKRRGKLPTREEYDKILIVCEGEKTEPNYFNEIVGHYRLSVANVVVTGKCGSNPKSVFEKAKQLYKEEKNKGDSYDKVYCVFDKDEHVNFEEICYSINKKRPSDTFFCITSIPCFEYWLLLHYKDTSAPFFKTQNKSASDKVIEELKKYDKSYKKKNTGIFLETIDMLDEAIERAERIYKQQHDEHPNPSTKVHELVDVLKNIKS